MIAVLIFVLTTLSLAPLGLSLIAFRAIFPKHTVKIHTSFLVPIGVLLIVLVGWPLGLHYDLAGLIEHLNSTLNEKSTLVNAVHYSIDYFSHNGSEVTFLKKMCLFYAIPFGLVLSLSFVLERLFQFFIRNYPGRSLPEGEITDLTFYWLFNFLNESFNVIDSFADKRTRGRPELLFGPFTLLAFHLGKLVDNTIINYMGTLTSYNQDEELLMLDIYTKDGFLFSGAYYDYFVEGGELSGICIVNPIRYRVQENPDTDKPNKIEAHIIPNKGKLVVPYHEMSNFHIWKFRRAEKIEVVVNTERAIARLFWLAELSYKYPRHVTRVDAKIPETMFDDEGFMKRLVKERNNFGDNLPSHVFNIDYI